MTEELIIVNLLINVNKQTVTKDTAVDVEQLPTAKNSVRN